MNPLRTRHYLDMVDTKTCSRGRDHRRKGMPRGFQGWKRGLSAMIINPPRDFPQMRWATLWYHSAKSRFCAYYLLFMKASISDDHWTTTTHLCLQQKKKPKPTLESSMTPAKLEKTMTIYGSLNAGEMASPNAELTAKVDMNTACKIDFIPAGAWL